MSHKRQLKTQVKFAQCTGLVLKSLCLSMVVASMSAQNPVVTENQQPGSSSWQIPWGGVGSDGVGQVKGYASAVSVNKGESVNFYISVNPAQTYTIDVYRMGWYQGLGGRLMQHIGPLSGTPQPACPTAPTTGLIECHWAQAYTLATQTSWTSGIYLALLTNSQNFQNYIMFLVRDDGRVAPLLFMQAVTTHQAYNGYPWDNTTGKSLYGYNSYGANTVGGSAAAVKVSFDRPYLYDGTGEANGSSFMVFEYPFVRWLEMSGYDITYATDIDIHLNPSHLLNYLGIVTGGHEEYWTKSMYDGAIAARDAGVNLGFFGANPIGWQIRLESSTTGVPNRVEVCYRDPNLDPNPDPTVKTVQWRDPVLNRPEQSFVGVMYISQVSATQAGWANYVVSNSANWVYAGTGFKDGDTVHNIVGYEADRSDGQYPLPNAAAGTYTLLSRSPLGTGGFIGNSSVYQAPGGAWVFGAGTSAWSWALDNSRGYNMVDARIQKTTMNILNRFITPLVNFSIAASPSSQTVTQGGATSYATSLTPTGGFVGQVTLSVTGLPSGATGTFTPNPSTSSSTLSVTTSPTTPAGTYTLTITGVSGSLSHGTTVSLIVNPPPDFTVAASPSSRSITPGVGTTYTATITPIAGFSNPVNLSVSGLPTGATGSFSINPTTASSTLTINTSLSTPGGSYTLTITGTSGVLTHTATVSLVIITPDFTLSASPSSQFVGAGNTATYTTTVTAVGGFAGQVTLAVSGLPTGATGTFNPNPATSSSSLSVVTSLTTPGGTYPLTITGVSGSLTHTATISLVVTAPGVNFDNALSTGFSWGTTSVTTPQLLIGSGANRAAMVMIVMTGNNATGITASLGGVSGTLCPGTDSGATAVYRTLIYQVINPPSGLQRATVSWTTSQNVDIGVITVNGADQTTPCTNGTFSASNSSPGTSTSVVITSNPGDLTASVAITDTSWVSPFTNQTLKWGLDSNIIGGDIGPGTGTTTHTWTDPYLGQTHSVSGANFKSFH